MKAIPITCMRTCINYLLLLMTNVIVKRQFSLYMLEIRVLQS